MIFLIYCELKSLTKKYLLQLISNIILKETSIRLNLKNFYMHELSIAQEIFTIVQQNVEDEKQKLVRSINVKIGKLSNVLPDSLLFCFDAIKINTNLQNASLMIDRTPVIIECESCFSKSEIEPPIFACPNCKSNKIKMISGDELLVREIELIENIEEKL